MKYGGAMDMRPTERYYCPEGNGRFVSLYTCVDENVDHWYCDNPDELTAAHLYVACKQGAQYVTCLQNEAEQRAMLLDILRRLREEGINVNGDIGLRCVTPWLQCEAAGDGPVTCYLLTAERYGWLERDLLIEAGKWVFLRTEWASDPNFFRSNSWSVHRISAKNIGQRVYSTENGEYYGTYLAVTEQSCMMKPAEVMDKLRHLSSEGQGFSTVMP